MLRFAPVLLTSILTLACTNGSTTDSDSAEVGTAVGTEAEGETSAGNGCNYPLRVRDCTDSMIVCQGFENDPGNIFEENGACIWPLLRDRVAGSWITIDKDPGDSPTTISLLIAQDGAIMRQVSHYTNGVQCSTIEPLQGCTLRDPTFFQACLGTVTPECLAYEGWFTDCATIDACL